MSKQPLQKSRLGRGLSSLINTSASSEPDTLDSPAGTVSTSTATATESSTSGTAVLELPLDNLSANPHQPRRTFDEGSLKELADSMRTTGVIQPVIARATTEGGYELIAGERRWRAAKIAGLSTLPVILKRVDPVMQAQMALVENLQRTDLNPIERGNAYNALMDNLGLTQAELATRLGEDRSVIGHHIRLLELPANVQTMLSDGRLTVGHAKVLVGVPDPKEQSRLAELAVSQGLNVRNLERVAGTPSPTPTVATAPETPSAHLIDLEKSLSRQIGMRVQVKRGKAKGKGRIIFHFASLDQFDDLMTKLGVSTGD